MMYNTMTEPSMEPSLPRRQSSTYAWQQACDSTSEWVALCVPAPEKGPSHLAEPGLPCLCRRALPSCIPSTSPCHRQGVASLKGWSSGQESVHGSVTIYLMRQPNMEPYLPRGQLSFFFFHTCLAPGVQPARLNGRDTNRAIFIGQIADLIGNTCHVSFVPERGEKGNMMNTWSCRVRLWRYSVL